MNPKITIAIPAYNSEKTLKATIESALAQNYPLKEILVLDDGSYDQTWNIMCSFGAKIKKIEGSDNQGIGESLAQLMREAKGKYIIYLCSDDLFADDMVCNDIVKQFDNGDPAIGVIGRMYYEFINGKAGVVGVFRDKNILTSSVNPSGMAFRCDPSIKGTNAVFVEMPYIVKQYLDKWRWTMLDYDSVAVRIHPGGNTGTKKTYYTGSAVENWDNIIGVKVKYYQQFIQLKCRCPRMLWREIRSTVKIIDGAMKDTDFWVYAITALIVPSWILRVISHFNRDYFQRGKHYQKRRIT